MTSDVVERVRQHKKQIVPGFTKRYNVIKLVWFEEVEDAYLAITREKEIKKWRREKKNKLINEMNPDWRDLYEDFK